MCCLLTRICCRSWSRGWGWKDLSREEETESKQRCGWRRCYWSLQSAKSRWEQPSSPWNFSHPSLPRPECYREGPEK